MRQAWIRRRSAWHLIRVVVLAALVGAPLQGAYASAQFAVRNYRSIDGMPVSSVSSLQVDGSGFLWLATHEGIARFDGKQFRIYDAFTTPEIGNNRIVGIYRGGAGRLYGLTMKGRLLRIGPDGVHRASADGGAAAMVRAVYRDPFCVTSAQGFFCEDADGNLASQLRFGADLDVAAALPSIDQRVWLLVPGKGILLQSGPDRQLVFRFENTVLYETPDSPQLATVGHDGSLIVALDRGLLRVGLDGESRWLLGGDEGGEVIRFSQIRRTDDGSIWIGSDRGIFHIRNEEVRLVRGLEAESDPVPMQSWHAPDGAFWESVGGRVYRESTLVLDSKGMVTDIVFDADGTVWIGTLRDGLYALFRPRVDALGLDEGLTADNVYTVSRGNDGTMWLGSLDGPVQAIGPDDEVERYGPESGLPGLNPWVVAVSPDDTVYVGTYAPGLFRRVRKGTRFERVLLPEAMSQARVLAFDFGVDGEIRLGTTQGVWRTEGASWHRVWPTDRDIRVHAVLRAADGSLWYGTESGLKRHRNGVVEAVAPEVIGKATVRGLFQGRDGAIWASTEGYGLVRIDIAESGRMHVARLGREQGLPSDSPHAVVEDREANLWVNSNHGIFRISRRNLDDWMSDRVPILTPLKLGLSDGMTELEGNGGLQPSAAFDAQGRIWFPYQNGVVRIDPDRFSQRRGAPVPIIDLIEAGGDALPAGAHRLPAGVRSVNIHYSASDLRDGPGVRFRYRILPGDDGWVDVRDQRVVSLASLSPGGYRFELIAANGDGDWSTEPATFEFAVEARWYETTRFRLAAIGLLMAIVVIVAQHRIGIARRRAGELNRQVEDRTKDLHVQKRHVETALAKLSENHQEIEKKNIRLVDQAARLEKLNDFRARLLADVGHELRTPLMLASMPLREVQQNAPDLAPAEQRRLDLSISQMDRLGLLIQQMLSLAQAEAGQLRLRISSFDLRRWLETVVDGFRIVNEKSMIGYEVVGDTGAQRIFADREHLRTVLDNLLDNAGRYAPPGSTVIVELRLDQVAERARIDVVDSGPGFPPSLAENMFRRFHAGRTGEPAAHAGRGGLGIGLATARELIELHGGSIGASSTHGEGARFWIELPLGTAHVSLDELDLERSRTDVPVTASVGRPKATGKLLLVEDHGELANYLGQRLGEYCTVRVTTDSAQALEWLEREEIGMVMSDVVLPTMSGIELCRRIKADERFRGLPVLLMSARTDVVCEADALGAGADAYLCKPFGFETLLEAVSRVWPDASQYFEHGEKIVAVEQAQPLLMPALKALADPDFSVQEWARRSYLSERQLRRRVIDSTGQTPVAWLREQRLLRVRKLVGNGACRTLSEAGASVGLDNPAYLYRIYRARFGSTVD